MEQGLVLGVDLGADLMGLQKQGLIGSGESTLLFLVDAPVLGLFLFEGAQVFIGLFDSGVDSGLTGEDVVHLGHFFPELLVLAEDFGELGLYAGDDGVNGLLGQLADVRDGCEILVFLDLLGCCFAVRHNFIIQLYRNNL